MTPVRGFTLMEMIITIIILAIIGTTFGLFIVPAVGAYNAQTQRAALVDVAENALRRMTRDIRIAVPNSVRITNSGTGFALEMVPTVDAARYCASGIADCGSVAGSSLTNAQQLLDVTATDTEFDVLGCFQDAGFRGSSGTPNYRLVTANSGSEIYTVSGTSAVMTPATTSVTLGVDPSGACDGGGVRRHHVTLSSAQRFCGGSCLPSPRQRLFVVKSAEAPVTYICDKNAGTLTRYWGYTFQAAQPTSAPANGTSALMASGVAACSITSQTSDVQNTGIVTLTVSLTNAVGERVSLMHQAQLDNSQ